MSRNEMIPLNGVVTFTPVGIDAKRVLTAEEWEVVAQRLSEYESGRAWALGDLYNLWPEGKAGRAGDDDSRRAKCEELGLNYGTMRVNALVAGMFNLLSRNNGLSFHHYRMLAIAELNEKQRQELIEKALDHGTILSVKALAKERDKLLGRRVEPEPPKGTEATEEFIEDVMDTLPEKMPKATKTAVVKGIRKVADKMSKDFHAAVQKEAMKMVDERTAHARASIEDQRRKAEEMYAAGLNLHKTASGILTHNEFRFVRSMLHPDHTARLFSGTLSDEEKRTEERNFAKAFSLFNQLEQAVNKWVTK